MDLSQYQVADVTEADLQNDVTCSAITDCFQSEPDTMCVIDVSSFLDANGKLLADKLERLPSSVRRLSFANGNNFLKEHPSLTTADFSSLQRVTKIGHKFLFRCNSLTSVHLPRELITIGYEFLNGCDSLAAMDLSQYQVAAVVVKEADLQNDDTCSAITDCFQSEPDTMCVIDVSSFLDANGKLLADKLERLPSSVGRLSFTNGKRCTEIGDNFLKQHPSLTTADFSSLQRVTKIGHKFLSRCNSLTSVHLPRELITVGYEFLNGMCRVFWMPTASSSQTNWNAFPRRLGAFRLQTAAVAPKSVTTF
eukprot:TRINITY_DN2362_c1_g1_i8.p1 TRINITY_DN2362_c1_g1~~TRINITY_DN2362_c1_g1_i8.p1  ORF type:complete len:308 (+),score=49.14 TRINITY_DN2362_c1_g1_i8:521-1444(+)